MKHCWLCRVLSGLGVTLIVACVVLPLFVLLGVMEAIDMCWRSLFGGKKP